MTHYTTHVYSSSSADQDEEHAVPNLSQESKGHIILFNIIIIVLIVSVTYTKGTFWSGVLKHMLHVK